MGMVDNRGAGQGCPTAPTDALYEPPRVPVSNAVIDSLLRHRSIRAFTDATLPDDVVESLLGAALHAPSYTFAQMCTIIRVDDPDVRAVIGRASGQAHVSASQGQLFVFVLDLHRVCRIRAEAGVDCGGAQRANLFLGACADTLLAAQNMAVAAESLGLGTVFLGSIHGDTRAVIDALQLPRLTFPLVGMLVGYPAQEPQFKPRLPLRVTAGVDRYPHVDDYHQELADYDAVLAQYYDLRNVNARVDSFTTQLVSKFGAGAADNSPVLEVLHDQGLLLS